MIMTLSYPMAQSTMAVEILQSKRILALSYFLCVSRKNRDAQAVIDRFDFLAFYVYSPARFTNPIDLVDHIGLRRAVFEVNSQDSLLTIFEEFIVADVSLSFQYFCQFDF